MQSTTRSGESDDEKSLEEYKLLLREASHRCANDYQMVVSLLRMQALASDDEAVQTALKTAADRVDILANSRSLERERERTLEAEFRHVCRALNSQAEPRGISIRLDAADPIDNLPQHYVTNLALCVNELATNAIKHAYRHGGSGQIVVAVARSSARTIIISVEDDGTPWVPIDPKERGGMGYDLIRALLRPLKAQLRNAPGGSKRIEIIVPV